MRQETEIRAAITRLESLVHQCRVRRETPGTAEPMRESATIEACIAASQISALAWVLGEIESEMHRSNRLKWI